MDSIEKLSELQKGVGYKYGELNAIALLGIYGEAGEVLNEVVLLGDGFSENVKHLAVAAAEQVDWLKKNIRDGKMEKPEIHLPEESTQKFDVELSDLLYYVNALAIGRGKTLNELAEISYQKVSKKLQAKI